jgi:diguanylate cyclase (GGDEF)-like protein
MLFMNGLIERNVDMTGYWIEKCQMIDYALQPIVNSYTGEVFGYEALLRNWKECGFKSIFDFFDRAFQDKALYTVDLELRKKAVEKMMTIEGINKKALFYNLDNRVLEMPDYSSGNTLELLTAQGFNKSNFYFELSERHEFKSDLKIIQILNQYKNQDFKIAIDDYGSGYSGLQLLYHSEPDVIKIDRFFIDGIDKDQKKKLFAENIVNMAHLMGIKVVAEGIETDQELNFCRELGCDFLQGYRIARPEQDLSLLKTFYNLDNSEGYGKRAGENQSQIIEERLTCIDPVYLENDGVSTLKRFQKDAAITLLPVVNEQNEPLGVIKERDLKQYVYSPYGISLFQNRFHSRGLESFLSRIPVGDVNCSLDRILDKTALSNHTEGILITRNSKYLGLLEPSSLIQLIYEQKLAHARDQNPLTGLPGNFTIHKQFSALLKEKECNRRIIFFDFNYFKPFNDAYGFRMGDRLIILFSEIIKKTFNINNDFIGHIGGDDFIVIQGTISDDEQCGLTREAQTAFASSALSYYSEDQRQCGYMKSRNRKGQWEKFPLLSVSAGVLEPGPSPEFSLDELNKMLNTLKKKAKGSRDHFARLIIDSSH